MKRVVLAALLLAGCSHAAPPHATPRFGGYPTFLPKSTLVSNAQHVVRDASAASPVLASQGDSVRVHLAHGAVTATVTGPQVPNEGLAYQSPTSPATWTVTLSQASGVVPLSVRAFNAIDERGRVYRLRTVGTEPPAQVASGQTVRFAVATTIATGEGQVRWIPVGHLAPVEWDFTVEID